TYIPLLLLVPSTSLHTPSLPSSPTRRSSDLELPNATLIDATALVNWQRILKSGEEVAFIRKAAGISAKIVRTAIDLARPGLRKKDRKSTRLNSSHVSISYAVSCLKKNNHAPV